MSEAKSQVVYYQVTENQIERVIAPVIGESRWILYVNGKEVVTFMATPRNLHHLALGFLKLEGMIAGLADVASVRVNLTPDRAYWFIPALGLDETRSMPICEQGVGSIEVRLTRTVFVVPERRVITSGCGGGVTFQDLADQQPPVASSKRASPGDVFVMMRLLNASATLYRECRGVHTSALGEKDRLLSIAEDVGRHNTLDKICGDCLMRGISTQDHILVTTGRVSSEMITKAAKMRVPIVVSRTSPTHLAIELARSWNMTLVGYAQGGKMSVYSGIDRIQVGRPQEVI
jgi:FdhD protein